MDSTSHMRSQTASSLSISNVMVLPFNNDDEIDPEDAANDCSSEYTDVETDDSTPSSASSISTSSVRSFPNLSDNIARADTLRKAIETAVDDIFAAFISSAVAMELKQDETQNEKQAQSTDACRDGDNDIDINENSHLLPRAKDTGATTAAPAPAATTLTPTPVLPPGHQTAYECTLDLADVFEDFGRIMQKLPPGDDGEGKEAAEIAALLADVVVAGYHEWAALHKHFGENEHYAVIVMTFRVYVTQCLRQAIVSVRALLRERGAGDKEIAAFPDTAVRSALLRCINVVRRQTSIATSEVWAASMSAILPQFVRCCTVPYDKASLHITPDTYIRLVACLLGTLGAPHVVRNRRKGFDEARERVRGRKNAETLEKYNEGKKEPVRVYANHWFAFSDYTDKHKYVEDCENNRGGWTWRLFG